MPEFNLLRAVSNIGESASSLPVIGNTVQNVASNLSGAFTGDRETQMKDSTHASRRFSLNQKSFTEVPRPKFLFWVQFFGNSFANRPGDNIVNNAGREERWAEGLSFLVKYIDKPKISPAVEELHQYNKRRLIHTGVEYEPITIRFHDSVNDGVLNFWKQYYAWYFGDGRAKDTMSWAYDVVNPDFHLNGEDEWGFNPHDDQMPTFANFFLSQMTLWQFYGGKYTKISFVNPKITSFDHDSNDYAEGATGSEITMQFRYEGVIYHNEQTSIDVGKERDGGLSADEKAALLLDLGDYYNVPEIRANTDLFSRLSDKALTGILQNVLTGNGGNAGDVLRGVISNSLPITKSSINALKNQVITNTITSVSTSALNSFGGFTFGSATDQRSNEPDTVTNPELVSYNSVQQNALFKNTGTSVRTRGVGVSATKPNAPDANNMFQSVSQGLTEAGEAAVDGIGSAASSVGSAIASSARELGVPVDDIAAIGETGTELTLDGIRALNELSRPTMQVGKKTSAVGSLTKRMGSLFA